MSETPKGPRLGGRYLRDPDTGERVRLKPDDLDDRDDVRAKPAAGALDPGSRDAAAPHTVRDDSGARGIAVTSSKLPSNKNPAPKAPQGQAAAGPDGPRTPQDSAKRGASARRDK